MFSLMLPTMCSAANPTSPNAPQQFVIGPHILDSRLARLHDKRNALEEITLHLSRGHHSRGRPIWILGTNGGRTGTVEPRSFGASKTVT